MSQEQPIRNVQEITSDSNAQDTKKDIADFLHNNVVANQTDPVGVQVKNKISLDRLNSQWVIIINNEYCE